MAFVKVSAGQSMAVRFPDRLWSPIVGNCEDQAAQLTERLRGTVAYAHIHTDGAHVLHGSQRARHTRAAKGRDPTHMRNCTYPCPHTGAHDAYNHGRLRRLRRSLKRCGLIACKS
jgi:hypothetical protein